MTRAEEDGVLAPQQHRLAPGATAWRKFPAPPQELIRLMQLSSGALLSLSTEAPFSAEFDEAGNAWQLPPTGTLAPRWWEPPATAALADGGLVAVGSVKSGPEAVSSAYRWHPKDGLWRTLGDLSRRYRSGAITQLPSGRIIHVGITGPNQIGCEATMPMTGDWQPCGAFTFKGAVRYVLSTLEDGRGAMVVGTDKLYIFDEASARWTLARLEFADESLKSLGAPVQRGAPVARAFEEGKPTPIDASLIAAKYWETQEGMSGPRLLWDARKHQWAYIFMASPMGMQRNAAFLPDGCALSGPPYRLFDPATGKVSDLEDFGVSEALQGSATVLADGTVAVIGVSSPGEAEKFARHKASCAGLASGDEGVTLMSARYGTDIATKPAAAEVAAAAAPPWEVQFGGITIDLRRIALVIAGVLATYLLLRMLVIPMLRPMLRALLARANDSAAGRIVIPLPRDTGRIVLYLLAAIIIVPMLVQFLAFQRAQQRDEELASATKAVDKSTGLLKAVPIPSESGNAAPAIPCRFVGTWISKHSTQLHRFKLTSDGRYAGGANRYGTEPGNTYKGYWSVQGEYMVWRNDGPGEADVNRIIDESEGRFTLIEGNGDHTIFELVERGAPGACRP